MPEKPSQITVLILLPLLYNPDGRGVHEPIEDGLFIKTALEISAQFTGRILHKYDDGSQRGFWWSKGILSQDEVCAFEVDVLDNDENRGWLKSYAKSVLLKRFRQDAIYLRFIGPVETLEVTHETIAK